MKRIMSFLLAIIMLVCLIPADLAYAREEKKLDVVLLNDGQYMIDLSDASYTSIRQNSVMQTLANTDVTSLRQAAVKPDINPTDNPRDFSERTIKVDVAELLLQITKINSIIVTVTCDKANYSKDYTINKTDFGKGLKVPVPKAKHAPVILVKFDDGRDSRYIVEAKSEPTNVVNINIEYRGHTGVATRWFGTKQKPTVEANYVGINHTPHKFELPKVDQNSVLRRGDNPWEWKDHDNIVNIDLVPEVDIKCNDIKLAKTIHLEIQDALQGKLGTSDYYYQISGDSFYGFTANMREKVSVGFKSGEGTWKSPATEPTKKDTLAGLELNESATMGNKTFGPVVIPDKKTLVAPAAKANKPKNEFKGWSLSDKTEYTSDELLDENCKPKKLDAIKAKYNTGLKAKEEELKNQVSQEIDKKVENNEIEADVADWIKHKEYCKRYGGMLEAYRNSDALTDFDRYALFGINKDTTFYAIYGPETQGKVNLKFVYDNNGTETNLVQNDLVDANDKNFKEAEEDALEKEIVAATYDQDGKETLPQDADKKYVAKKAKAPKFTGYKLTKIEIINHTGAEAGYKAQFRPTKDKLNQDISDKTKFDTIKYVYEKIDDIIEKKPGTTTPDGYVDITFTNAKDGSKVASKFDAQTKAADIVYSINPKAQVKIVKDTTSNKYQLVGKDAKNVDLKKDVPVVKAEAGYKVVDHKDGQNATGWNFDNYNLVNQALTDAKTFTAKVEQKGNGTAKLAYVDDNNTALDPANTEKLKVANETYNPNLSGKDGTALPTYTVQNAPKVLGYVFDVVVSKKYNNADVTTYTEGQEAVITLKYKKLDDTYKGKKEGGEDTPEVPDGPKKDDIINTIKDTYVKVKFLADEATRTSDADTDKDNDNYRRGKLNSDENEVFYYINPKAQNTLGAFIATTETNGKILVPTVKPKEGYKKATQEWNPDLEAKKAQAVDASNKELTFVAQYVQKGTGYVNVKYVLDGEVKDITDYKLPGKTYITQKSGKEDAEVKAADLTADYLDLLGYEKDTSKGTNGIEVPANAKYLTANPATVKFNYKKIDDIVEPGPGVKKPAGYVEVRFTSGDKGKFNPDQDVTYYVNPRTVTIDKDAQKLSGKDKTGTPINKDFPEVVENTITKGFVANKVKDGKYDKDGTQQWALSKNELNDENKLKDESKDIVLTAMYLGKFNVKYVINVVPDGKTLPDALKALTAKYNDEKADIKDLLPGDPYEKPDNLNISSIPNDILVEKDDKGKEIGKWSTNGMWKREDKNGNITFTLTWTFNTAKKKSHIEVIYPLSKIYVGDYKTVAPEIYGAATDETDDEPFVVNRRQLEDMGVRIKAHRDGRLTIEILKNYRGPKRFTIDLDVSVLGQYVQTYADVIVLDRVKREAEPVDEEPMDTRVVEEHKAYMFGYTDGSVRPNGSITRAEAAALVTRLLGIEAYASSMKPSFTDTPSAWYNKAINAAVQRGIMKGYPNGSFRPNAPITRAEFTQMIYTIDNKPYGVAPFADVNGHWAERAIGSEYQAKRIAGYPDGTFRPDAYITRCEAVVILNKIFERNYDAMSAINAINKEKIKVFTDLHTSFWGFNDMVEATNTHLFKRRVKGEVAEDWVEVK